MLDLNNLENKLDTALESETKESLTKFLNKQRNMQKFKENLKETLKFQPEELRPALTKAFNYGIELTITEYEEKLRWIPVDEKEPECGLEAEGISYSKYLEIKVKGYQHPFIGYYVKANDDQFFDFIHKTVDEGIKQDEITHYRFVL